MSRKNKDRSGFASEKNVFVIGGDDKIFEVFLLPTLDLWDFRDFSGLDVIYVEKPPPSREDDFFPVCSKMRARDGHVLEVRTVQQNIIVSIDLKKLES